MSLWFGFVLGVLATWRLSHLVAHEDGPFGLVAWARGLAGEGQAGRLMDCPYCLSLWFAVPFAAWLASDVGQGLVLWLALSGGSCLLEHGAAALRTAADGEVVELPPGPEED